MQTTKNFKFGISSWSYPWSVGVSNGAQPKKKMSALDIMKKAKEYEVNLVQFADNLPLEDLTENQLDELAEFSNLNNIAIEVGTKGIGVDHLLHFLEISLKLKSPILRTLPALFGKKAVFEEVEENIRQVLPVFEENGVIIVLENTEAFKAEEYVLLMQKVNHPNFRMCVDLANALGIMQGPEQTIDLFLPYCGNYHFKDVKIIRSRTLMGFTVEGTPAGQGQLSLPWILQKLVDNNIYPSIIIELWPPFQDTLEETIKLEDQWVRESIDYFKKEMQNWQGYN